MQEAELANIGSTDRIIRFILGAALVVISLLPQMAATFATWGSWKYALTAAGAVMIGTAFMRVCPAYIPLGINTCGRK